MSDALLQRMLKAREKVVPIADDEGSTERLKITLRRPAILRHAERVFAPRPDGTVIGPLDVLAPFLVGWDGFIERDFYPSGGDEPVAFHHGLALEWIGDRVEIERQLSEQANDMVREHLEKRGNLQKN